MDFCLKRGQQCVIRMDGREVGIHQLNLWAVDKYFAFSRLVLYTKTWKENNLVGIKGAQPLPAEWEMGHSVTSFMENINSRPVFCAPLKNSRDGIIVTDRILQEKSEKKITPDWYFERGASTHGLVPAGTMNYGAIVAANRLTEAALQCIFESRN